ncbi:PKD domain-containing protein [Candidatus Peregrinibacteria bacterium]|jgi:PKD repeat protein|nr:PKD domain-containing protein [Candidatus Peregrinibacteria bacterium]MBT4632002.1 PKD domain-containing protein [Candidatus Peregrinibacteria bacterium]MBT5516948.1 PKD domain-containing protein [Candidatus Peregrinibacteria bacterium]MBT5823795.1 PKD domain-containing protein [Candidatus Peregrinibacteria bacterium]
MEENTPPHESPQENTPENSPELPQEVSHETPQELPKEMHQEVVQTAAPDSPLEAVEKAEKSANKKDMMKRLAMVLAISYGVTLLFVIVWAFAVGTNPIGLFNVLPLSQAGFGNFLMMIFNILIGLIVLVALGISGVGFLKSMLAPKTDLAAKKKHSKLALYSGIAFFILAIIWLVGLVLLTPRLVTEQRFSSPIITSPANPIGLTAPIEVIFDAGSVPIDPGVYEVLSYSWDFGDGSSGNGEQVAHRYTKKAEGDGLYTVTLSLNYMDIKSGEQFTGDFVTEVGIQNELVAAVFSALPGSGEVPLTVKFDATASYDPDGEIINYEWDFDGDGRYDDGEGVKSEYEFTQEGNFDVSLRVTDNNGEFNVSTFTVEAGSVGGMRAIISSDVPEGDPYYVGEKYEFTGELSQIRDGVIKKYSWDFGDGTKVQSRNTSHTFEKAGDFDLTLTVENSDGDEDVTLLEILVLEEGTAPQGDIQASTLSGPVPLTVVFDGTGSQDPDDDITDFEWDFDGDGTVDDSGDKVSHTYEEQGVFNATLFVTDSTGITDETTVSIEAGAQGIIGRVEVDSNNGEVPHTVRFDASASTYKDGSIVSYEYDFGDGSDIYIGGSSVTYKYNEVGTFSASVTVVGADGLRNTAPIQIVVRPVALTACFTVNIDNGSAPIFLSVDPSCSQGTIDSYRWEFGDGEISFDRKPDVHNYTETGVYTIHLEVTSSEGIVDNFEKSITVN